MSRSLDHPRTAARRICLAVVAIAGMLASSSAFGQGREGLVDLGRFDPRLQGHLAPRGFKVQVVAAGPSVGEAAAMAFDDAGDILVAEWRPAERTFETSDTLSHPEGGTTRVRRTRKSTTDRIRRLRDADGDGLYESSEVVLEGVEMPSAILPIKNALYLACVGRLERWTDEDNDGRFETRAALIDGFAAHGKQALTGITLGPDGWLYLSAGDADSHAVGPDGSRADVSRSGAVFRCRLDGSQLRVHSTGYRGPSRSITFDAASRPFAIDDDPADGSKFQGIRLIQPSEDGDYGWRLRPGASTALADFDRGAADGERPGKLGPVARLGRGSPSGLVIYNGTSLPEPIRDAILYPDTFRKTVRALRVEPESASFALKGGLTLMASDDDRFRPIQLVTGADGAVYVLDRRATPDEGGRIYRITWEGDGATAALATKPNHWKRIFAATGEQLVFQFMASPDLLEADRAQRELVDRGAAGRPWCVAYAGNVGAPLHARLLGVQGARQLWNDEVEATLTGLLEDPQPEVRRLAAQALAWEPKTASPKLVTKLLARLDDPDGRVVREVVMAVGRHAEPNPRKPAAILLRWLYAHPDADPVVRDAFLRGLERMGDGGVEEVALAVRTRSGVEREAAVKLFTSLRTASAAEQLDSLVKIPDLNGPERLALIRQYPDIPAEVPLPTQGLADWVVKHSEADAAAKLATLDACRLAGNPASGLILALLDDDDESVRLAATRLAAQTRPPGAVAKLAERLKEKKRSPAELRAIVRALGQAGPSAFASLDAVHLESDDLTLRRLALRSMAESNPGRSGPALEAALTARDPALRAEAVRILGQSPATAIQLAQACRSRLVGRDDLPGALRLLRKQESPEVRKLVAAIEEDALGSGAIDPTRVRERMRQGADPWKGLGIFFRESPSRCADCHAVEGRGGSSGPSLTLGTQAPTADRAVEAILHHPKPRPGAAASRARNGRAEVVPAGDESITLAVGVDEPSARPDRAAIELDAEEVADLAAFLLSKPAQSALKHGPVRLDRVLAIGPLALGADKLRLPLDRLDPSQTFPGQDGVPARWITLEGDASGTLNLRGEFNPKPGRAYLAVRIRSPREQSAVLRLKVEGAARAYLDGKKVADLDAPARGPTFEPSTPGLPAPMTDIAPLPLKSGANLLILAIDRDGTGDDRAALEIASPEPVEVESPKN